jgi:acetolactate synthase-1/2/3 large subunit
MYTKINMKLLADRLNLVQKDGLVTFSDYLIARLTIENCNRVFSLTGGGIMYLVDAIYRQPNINMTCVHNEQFAGASADGYSRVSGAIGCAIGTTGPGLANLFTSVVAAYQDSSSVLFIGGQVKESDSSRINKYDMLRQNGTFEFDSIESFKPITKYCAIITDEYDGIKNIEEAMYHMLTGRKGPALLEIPLDLQGKKLNIDKIFEILDVYDYEVSDQYDLDKNLLIKEFKESKKPLFLIGNGVLRSSAANKFKSFLKDCNIPYILTPQALELSNMNDLCAGVIGLRGNRSANILSQEADHIFIIGSSLHQQIVGWESSKFAPNAKKSWFDIDESSFQVRGDALSISRFENVSCEDFIKSFSENDKDAFVINNNWSEYILYLNREFRVYSPLVDGFSYYDGIQLLSSFRSNLSAITTDAGSAWYIVPQAFNIGFENIKFVSSGSLGAMGMALPFANGISCTRQDEKYTLAITGDGSIMTCLQELATLKASENKVILAVFNNSGYRSIKSTHDKFFDGRRVGTDASNGVFIPELRALAESFEIDYLSINSFEKGSSEINSFFESSKKNIIMEFFVNEDTIIEPSVVSILNNNGQFVTPPINIMSPLIEYFTFAEFINDNA